MLDFFTAEYVLILLWVGFAALIGINVALKKKKPSLDIMEKLKGIIGCLRLLLFCQLSLWQLIEAGILEIHLRIGLLLKKCQLQRMNYKST